MNRTTKPTEPWSRDRLLSWGLCDATGRVLPARGQMPRMTRSTTQHTERLQITRQWCKAESPTSSPALHTAFRACYLHLPQLCSSTHVLVSFLLL